VVTSSRCCMAACSKAMGRSDSPVLMSNHQLMHTAGPAHSSAVLAPAAVPTQAASGGGGGAGGTARPWGPGGLYVCSM
jgi:hypothetical protein